MLVGETQVNCALLNVVYETLNDSLTIPGIQCMNSILANLILIIFLCSDCWELTYSKYMLYMCIPNICNYI